MIAPAVSRAVVPATRRGVRRSGARPATPAAGRAPNRNGTFGRQGSRNLPVPAWPGRENEPSLPEGVDTRVLHRAVRAELRSLPKDLAEIVAGHLVLAGQLVDEDPELAYAHAEAARRRASRLPIVREAAAETAYAAGHYDVALSEFRALRRMTGSHDYLPVMADCERALGRPHNALKLAKEASRLDLDPALRIEMIIVEAGARHDLGQDPEARRILDRAVHALPPQPALARPAARLHYAYADALLAAGKPDEARRWFASAAERDADGETDAQQRVDELDGMRIDFDEDDGAEPEPRGARGVSPREGTEPRFERRSTAVDRRIRRCAVRPGRRGLSGPGRGRRRGRGDRRAARPRHPARIRHQQCRTPASGRGRASGGAGHRGVGRGCGHLRPGRCRPRPGPVRGRGQGARSSAGTGWRTRSPKPG